MKNHFYVVPFEKFLGSQIFISRRTPTVERPRSTAKLAAKLLIALTVIPMGLMSTSPGNAQVARPGCYCIGGYRYVGGTSGSTYGHDNGSTYRWDNCYMQSCPAQQQQPNASGVAPASIARGSLVIVTTNGGTLNARSGPGANYPVVAQLPNGRTLQLSGSVRGNWVQLINGGWVNSAYLRFAQ